MTVEEEKKGNLRVCTCTCGRLSSVVVTFGLIETRLDFYMVVVAMETQV